MYLGFDLQISNNTFYKYNNFSNTNFLEDNKRMVENILDKFIGADGIINAKEIQEQWFPQMDADVFLSHSHKDEDLAKGLAGFFKESFGLKTFIDSCVWGYCDDLLLQIDDRYCLNPGRETYNYSARNRSTSHVHTMLAMALAEMIDKTECIIFLNTPNSISPNEIIKQTSSPWLYNEITITKMMRRKTKEEHRRMVKKALFESKAQERDMDFVYDVPLDHLISLNDRDLIMWSTRRSILRGDYPLDGLYRLKDVK